jgi:hypothetical protein
VQNIWRSRSDGIVQQVCDVAEHARVGLCAAVNHNKSQLRKSSESGGEACARRGSEPERRRRRHPRAAGVLREESVTCLIQWDGNKLLLSSSSLITFKPDQRIALCCSRIKGLLHLRERGGRNISTAARAASATKREWGGEGGGACTARARCDSAERTRGTHARACSDRCMSSEGARCFPEQRNG